MKKILILALSALAFLSVPAATTTVAQAAPAASISPQVADPGTGGMCQPTYYELRCTHAWWDPAGLYTECHWYDGCGRFVQ